MSLNCVTGYWYPNRSTEILHRAKPIQSANMLAQDILDELNEVHPFKKDPFLIGKVKNYVYTKKYHQCRPKNQMSGLFFQKCKKSTPTNIFVQRNVFDLGYEDFYCSNRDIKATAHIKNVPSQECYVFGKQAIINAVGEQLTDQNNIIEEIKSLDTLREVGKSDPISKTKEDKHKKKNQSHVPVWYRD